MKCIVYTVKVTVNIRENESSLPVEYSPTQSLSSLTLTN